MKHFKKSTPSEIAKMRELRKQGMSYERIARIFKKDHSTIVYWCRDGKRIKLFGKNNPSWKGGKSLIKIIEPKKWREEGINEGMRYKDYLRKEAQKKNSDYIYKLWK